MTIQTPQSRSEGYQQLSGDEWWRLQSGEPSALVRLRSPARLFALTPFSYPGKGSVLVFLDSDGNSVRLSEGGRLLRYLETQGLDVSVDQVLSRTVFHAVREVPGMAMGNGTLFVDVPVDDIPQLVPRFIQTILEIVGLRHSKYKDALVQLSRAQEGLLPTQLS